MKLLPLAAACAGLLLAGCESGLPDDVRSALGPRESPRSRTFAADQRATYAAARLAVDDLDYHFEKGGPAEGTIQALSRVARGDDAGSGRQLMLKVSMQPAPESGTEVEVSFTEIIEPDSANQPGFATETPLHDTPLYDVYFKSIQAHLLAPAGPQ